MTALEWEVLQHALRTAGRWRRRADVISIGIGQRCEHGHWQRGRACVVVKVAWKLSALRLRAARRRAFPSSIEVVVRGRRRRVPVDVQETRGQTVGALHGLVGGSVTHAGAVIGSVSGIVRADDARLGMISGHVARTAGRRLVLAGLWGRTRAPVFTSRMDHCLVDFDALPGGGCDLDGHALTGVAPVASLRPGDVVYFNRARTGERVALQIRHLQLPAVFDYSGVPRRLVDLVVTEGLTVDGDSGALLYDNAFRAIGTLVGMLGGESYFLPCEISLPILGVTLC